MAHRAHRTQLGAGAGPGARADDDLVTHLEAQLVDEAQRHLAHLGGLAQHAPQLALHRLAVERQRAAALDVEEINSTLRAGDTAASAPQPTSQKAEEPRKSGFARGFALTILLFLVLLMIYTNAGKIAETMPQADPYLSAYVTWVDQARLWLDAQVKALQQPEL